MRTYYIATPYLSMADRYYTCKNKKEAARYFAIKLNAEGPSWAVFSIAGCIDLISRVHI